MKIETPYYTLYNADCFDVMKGLPDNSIDAVITDPPYGILQGHKIETDIDKKKWADLCFAKLKDNAFLSIFGMFPSLLNWHNELVKKFRFKEHIVWCKRSSSMGSNGQLLRIHENIFIYIKGSLKYFQIQGNYEDVLMPRTIDGIQNIESVYRQLSYWKGIAEGKKLVNTCTGINKTNDDYYQRTFKRTKNVLGREKTNFQTVWSFLPHNKALKKGTQDGGIKHPTVKPILLMERLVELFTTDNAVVLDPFMGSGTTGMACMNLGRKFIGIEKEKEYFDIAVKRIDNALKDKDIQKTVTIENKEEIINIIKKGQTDLFKDLAN